MTKDLEYYLKLEYLVEIVEDRFPDTGKKAYVVSIPDLPGCDSFGRTINEAIRNLQEAKKLYLEACLETGQDIPEPAGKGVERVTVNVPEQLYREFRKDARKCRQSVGDYLLELVHRYRDLQR